MCQGPFHRMRAEFWLERKSRRASLAIQGFLRSRTELQLFSAELALMPRHTMQACKFVGLMILLCVAMVPPAADGGWLKHVPKADRRPEEACLKTTAPNVTQRMPLGARNGQACEAIARSVPPTEKSSGYGETATCRRVRPPGRRWQSRCAGRLSPASRAWGLPRPPLPSLLIPSRIRYYIGMCRTPRRLTLHINSWRSAWQTIC
jgi:hypothetical protein